MACETKTLKALYFPKVEAVESQALSTVGQADVNLHRLTANAITSCQSAVTAFSIYGMQKPADARAGAYMLRSMLFIFFLGGAVSSVQHSAKNKWNPRDYKYQIELSVTCTENFFFTPPTSLPAHRKRSGRGRRRRHRAQRPTPAWARPRPCPWRERRAERRRTGGHCDGKSPHSPPACTATQTPVQAKSQ